MCGTWAGEFYSVTPLPGDDHSIVCRVDREVPSRTAVRSNEGDAAAAAPGV